MARLQSETPLMSVITEILLIFFFFCQLGVFSYRAQSKSICDYVTGKFPKAKKLCVTILYGCF